MNVIKKIMTLTMVLVLSVSTVAFAATSECTDKAGCFGKGMDRIKINEELKKIMPEGFEFKGVNKGSCNGKELPEGAKTQLEELGAKLQKGGSSCKGLPGGFSAEAMRKRSCGQNGLSEAVKSILNCEGFGCNLLNLK